MFSQKVRRLMDRERMLTALPQATVRQAALLMAGNNTGAVLVVENEALLGIFTERDVVFRVIAQGLDTDTTPLAAVMTATPVTVEPERTYGHALQLMYERGFRHLPVVSDGGRILGVFSVRDALPREVSTAVGLADFNEQVNDALG